MYVCVCVCAHIKVFLLVEHLFEFHDEETNIIYSAKAVIKTKTSDSHLNNLNQACSRKMLQRL